jgi:hypothetical protein
MNVEIHYYVHKSNIHGPVTPVYNPTKNLFKTLYNINLTSMSRSYK